LGKEEGGEFIFLPFKGAGVYLTFWKGVEKEERRQRSYSAGCRGGKKSEDEQRTYLAPDARWGGKGKSNEVGDFGRGEKEEQADDTKPTTTMKLNFKKGGDEIPAQEWFAKGKKGACHDFVPSRIEEGEKKHRKILEEVKRWAFDYLHHREGNLIFTVLGGKRHRLLRKNGRERLPQSAEQGNYLSFSRERKEKDPLLLSARKLRGGKG